MLKKIVFFSLAILPVGAFAIDYIPTGGAPLGNIGNLIVGVGGIITYLVPIAFALIVLAFFWGLAKFVFNVADEEGRKAGKDIMIWSIVAIFVAASIWGIVKFIGTSLGITDTAQQVSDIRIPTVSGGN